MSEGPGLRRQARERALGLLYEAETKGLDARDVLDTLPLAPDPYAATLVIGVAQHLPEIDARLADRAQGWSVARMPALDRAILRMATFELMDGEVPVPVVIDEAVELAKQFSTDDSGRFVNGVLSALAGDLRPAHDDPAP